MKLVLRRSIGRIALLSLAGAGPEASDPPPGDVIVVTGQRLPIVVRGRSVRCRPLASDPQDRFDASPQGEKRLQSVLLPRPGGGGFRVVPWSDAAFFDYNYFGGPGVWRREGNGIDQYIFRSPKDASLLCIGSKWPNPEGFGQLAQMVDAAPYYGKRVRFTAWVASRIAPTVNFFLASGDPDSMKLVVNGGNTNNHAWGGSHGWTPMMIEIGPISKDSKFISFGFNLNGDGDLWVYKPKLEAVPPDEPYQRKGDIFVIGTDREDSSGQPSE